MEGIDEDLKKGELMLRLFCSQSKHVNPQTFSETFICLWSGCKVFGRPSCSRTWLERHVLSHGGNKPYKCIVDNCGQRFGSQVMERMIFFLCFDIFF